MAKPIISAERLRELLSYDPETGVFKRLVSRQGPNSKAGSVAAGRLSGKGYRRIKIDGRSHFAHRLAWIHIHGRWPADQLDHVDGQRDNNKISNLREVSNAQNMQNQRRAPSNNKSSGLLGVSFDKPTGKWRATIQVDGKSRRLGRFSTPELAYTAYVEAKRQLHPMGML